MRIRSLLAVAPLLLVCCATAAHAGDVPSQVSHQGLLTDSNGVVVADGLYTLKFEIFDAPSAGQLLFSQEIDVHVTGGVYNVLLSDSGGPGTLVEAFENPSTYLGITITGVPQGSPITTPEALSPRQKFASVPYAMVAPRSDPLRELLETRDVNNDAVVDLALPVGFERYEIELMDISPVSPTPVEFHARASTDGGANFHETPTSYSWVIHFVRATYHGYNGDDDDSEIQLVQPNSNESLKNAAGKAFNGTVTILNLGGGNSYFTLVIEGAHYGGNVNETILTSGSGQLVATSERVDVIRFKVSSGNLGGGRFRVFGLR